ncbi:MAG: T9SS type A sorting domain-containing protein [Bacteroidota bacterium]
MKYVSVFLLFLFSLFTNCYSQNRDNIWQLGYFTFNSAPKCGVDFNSGNATSFSLIRPMSFFITNASICDTNGQLLFYTNGIYVANRNHDTLQNGSDFNPGYITNLNASDGLAVSQGCIILPYPDSNNKYVIIHESGEEFMAHNQTQDQPLNLSYSIVDMNLDGGLGGIDSSKKSIHLINDTLVLGRITACKHANGRDWWIVVQRFYSNIYYKFLLTPYGFSAPYSQQIGDSINYDALGTSVFSPDGNMYATVSYDNTLNIFHFDRCTGNFYDSTFIQVPNPTPGQPDNEPFSCAFSPNSRFLYVVEYTRIIQYDVTVPNIAATQTYVAQWDSFTAPFNTYFFLSQLAPDGRIYISTYGGDSLMHYIEYPDSQGIACNVVQNNFFFVDYNASIPNFPNYNLGADTTSILCDSLSVGITSITLSKGELKIFYHPIWQTAFINASNLQGKNYTLNIFDITGKQLFSEQGKLSSPYFIKDFHCNFANGIYIISLSTEKENLKGKFVKN